MQCALCRNMSRTDGFTSGATFRDGCSPLAGPCSLPYTLQVLDMQQVLYLYFTVPYTLQVLYYFLYTAVTLMLISLFPMPYRYFSLYFTLSSAVLCMT